jgi:DNA end-binding protein Ku
MAAVSARPTWKGYLRLSLVSCPVRLYPGTTSSGRVSFHLLSPKTHHRVQMRATDPETGEVFERGDLVRGYEFEKGRYVTVEKEELEKLRIESSNTIDLQRFVDADTVDPLYLDAPYYLTPDGKIAEETYRVIAEAMRREKAAGIGRLVLSSREHPVLLAPHGAGLMLTTLRSADEVRSPDAYFEDLAAVGSKLDEDMVDLAAAIIAKKRGKFDPEAMTEDRYQEAVMELVRAKVKGQRPVVVENTGPAPVIDLMEALRKSLAREGGGGKVAASGGGRTPRSSSASSREDMRRRSGRSSPPARTAGAKVASATGRRKAS